MKKLIFILSLIGVLIGGSVSAYSWWQYSLDTGTQFLTCPQRKEISQFYEIDNFDCSAKKNTELLNAFLYDYSQEPMLGLMVDKLSKTIRESITAGTDDTSINVDPLVTLQGHRLVMSDIGNRLFFRIGSGDNVTWGYCTGITDNTTYYTLTGCVLGLYDYGDSLGSDTANINSHSSGEAFVITNQHHWYLNYFPDKTNSSTISGRWFYDIYPEASGALSATTSRQLLTLGQAQNLANQGAATSTESVAGISELATQIENASSTKWGIDDPHIQQSKHATSTPYSGMTGLYDVWTENDGKINQSFIDYSDNVSSTAQWTFSNQAYFTATTTFATSTFTSSTISNLNNSTSTISTQLTYQGKDMTGLVNSATTTLHSHHATNGSFTTSTANYIGTFTVSHHLGVIPNKITMITISRDAPGNDVLSTSNGFWTADTLSGGTSQSCVFAMSNNDEAGTKASDYAQGVCDANEIAKINFNNTDFSITAISATTFTLTETADAAGTYANSAVSIAWMAEL